MDDEAVKKLVEHWRNGATDDLDAALCLFEKRKLPQTLFFLHLSIEKALKSRVAAITRDHPPRIHNLPRLAELADIGTTPDQLQMLLDYNEYCMSGRYPGMRNVPATLELCTFEVNRAKDVLKWLLQP